LRAAPEPRPVCARCSRLEGRAPKPKPVIHSPLFSSVLGFAEGRQDRSATRARSWMSDLTEGRVNSFEEIARSENKVERHIRHLAPLAFVSPRIVEAIANGSAPADLTVTTLARALPYDWAAQEHRLGIT
jgi:site-specific DNA recombinase